MPGARSSSSAEASSGSATRWRGPAPCSRIASASAAPGSPVGTPTTGASRIAPTSCRCSRSAADCLLREEPGWGDHTGSLSELRRNLDLIAERDLVWSYLQQDWSSLRGNPELAMTETLRREVRDRVIDPARYADHYERALSAG